MDARELRIGNLLQIPDPTIKNLNNCENIFKVTSYNLSIISLDHYKEIIHIPNIHIDYVYPIPLTEEWLIKFGFEKLDLFYSHKKYGYKVAKNMDGFYIWSNAFSFNPPLKYVHQLQNLYFALTGEELTIKE
jgi:hypothetical protein